MGCPDVELACCKLCHKPIASNLGECIHCGVCNPVEKKRTPWWHYALVCCLIFIALYGALRHDADDEPYGNGHCGTEQGRDRRGC